MQNRFAIRSTRVVTPSGERPATIIISGGVIAEVAKHSASPIDLEIHDYGDLVISPGVVDIHVHINEPGRTDWEGFETATAAAAAGGVTTLIDMPLNSSPVTTTVAALEAKRSAAEGKCRVDVGFYGGVVPGNEDDVQPLVEAGVFGLKAFMCDSGLDEFPASGEPELRSTLAKLHESGVPLLVHAEIIGDAPDPQDESSFAQFVQSRPDQFEVDAIEMMIRLCEEFQSPVHIVHLATGQALSQIRAAKQSGLPITVETCPHYLHFCSEEIEDGATSFKCTPPIRDASNRDELIAAVQDGVIESIGSDHSPCPPEMKQLDTGNLSKAWGGIASLQLTLSVMSTIATQQGWSTELLADRLSKRPAEIVGLGETKGQIKARYDADFVVWNPEAKFTVCGTELYHRHDVTPYEGHELYGAVTQTYVRGNLVFDSTLDIGNRLVGNPLGALLVRNVLEVPDPGQHSSIEIEEGGHAHAQHEHAYTSRKHGTRDTQSEMSSKQHLPLGESEPEQDGQIPAKTATNAARTIAAALNARSVDEANHLIGTCCAAPVWIERMSQATKRFTDEQLLAYAADCWRDIDEVNLLEAFSAHPRIGDVDTLRAKYANTKAIASGEQSGVDSADEAVLQRLATANDEYFEKFGFIFIVCATGKTAKEMLDMLEERLPNDRETELKNAAAEQLKITIIRLRKLIA